MRTAPTGTSESARSTLASAEDTKVDALVPAGSRRSFVERAERVLILGMVVGIILIMQRDDLMLFQAGLSVLVASTLLQIAVGNVPKSGKLVGSLARIVFILGIVALIFAIGIALVPTLSRLGR